MAKSAGRGDASLAPEIAVFDGASPRAESGMG
jgi:hypothetical protein